MDYELMLLDRIAKIQSINSQLDLENNGYIAFSGGKDSTILHYLIDLALPNNNIPRVFSNTGIEFKEIVKFVKDLASKDDRIIILNQDKNIKSTLEQWGYPFKSKEFSQMNCTFYNMREKGLNVCRIYQAKINGTNGYDDVPKNLRYLFIERPFKISSHCCKYLKKDLMRKWVKQSKKTINITGMRKEEGGQRVNLTCLSSNNTKFNPLLVVSEEWENEFIKQNNIKLCSLYYLPFNFKRTGCKGCPFNIKVENELKILKEKLPNEYKQCLILWNKVYKEYTRVGYRIKDEELKKDIWNIKTETNI